jgi:hypothetical protein
MVYSGAWGKLIHEKSGCRVLMTKNLRKKFVAEKITFFGSKTRPP